MQRIKRLIEILKEKELDAVLITNEANVSYLTGFTGDSSTLVVGREACVFITDGRYTEQAGKECFNEIEIMEWIKDNRQGVESYSHVMDKLKVKRLGFEGDVLAFSAYMRLSSGLKQVEMLPVTGWVEQLRLIKDDAEIQFLKTAGRISDTALELTIPQIKVGMTEMEILALLEYNLKTNGAEGLSFETMVLSGAKTSLLHGKADQKPLETGDFLLFDFGALYKGYHADISRTFVMGRANDQQKELYDIIQSAQANACKAIKAGVMGPVPDTEARAVIPERYMAYYYPGLGHGVGLDIHEAPTIKNTSDFTYREGMTVTIEPGIYIPDWGGLRIEDSMVVTRDGVESFNRFPRELTIL